MTVITYGSSVSAGNAKTRRHDRRRKLAIERDSISNIIDSVFGCDAPDASQEEIRKHTCRVDRATSLGSLRDKKEQEVVHKQNRTYYRDANPLGNKIHAVQRMKLSSKPLI
jgi:hypothetical protein